MGGGSKRSGDDDVEWGEELGAAAKCYEQSVEIDQDAKRHKKRVGCGIKCNDDENDRWW